MVLSDTSGEARKAFGVTNYLMGLLPGESRDYSLSIVDHLAIVLIEGRIRMVWYGQVGKRFSLGKTGSSRAYVRDS